MDCQSASKECPNMAYCAMYNLFKLSSSLAVWKINYCAADYTRCARYMHAALGRSVPINLMPNGSLLKRGGSGDKR